MKQEYLSTSLYQTKKLGEKQGQQILKTNKHRALLKTETRIKKTATIIAIEGELGSGKTTFVQGFAKELGIKEKILSPTFVIMKKFAIPSLDLPSRRGGRNSQFAILFHIDCYRIKKTKEILDLNFNEIISNPKNIIVIEWADRIKKIMPKNIIWIKFDFIDRKKRKIVVQ